MTSEEYAERVRAAIMEVRNSGVVELSARTDYAFSVLARGAAKRCIGPGADQYEVEHDVQRFEDRDLLEILEDAREEALDLPAYMVQLRLRLAAYGGGLEAPIMQAIAMSAQLLAVLNTIEEELGQMMEAEGLD